MLFEESGSSEGIPIFTLGQKCIVTVKVNNGLYEANIGIILLY